jgi:putative phosphoribosyl transferase
VTDDELATGASMIAILHGLRNRKPAKFKCAVPVASAETLYKVAESADEDVFTILNAD